MRSLIFLVLISLVTGCGAGTAAVAGGGTSTQAAVNNSTVGSDLQVSDPNDAKKPSLTSPAAVHFRLTDEEGDFADVQFFYTLPGGMENSISMHAASAPITNLAPGDHIVLWDYKADFFNERFAADITVRLEVVGGTSPPPQITGVGNDLAFTIDHLLDFTGQTSVITQISPTNFQGSPTKISRTQDIDGDGDQDLYELSPGFMAIYTQVAPGQFSFLFAPLLGGDIQGAEFVDLNGDGVFDLALTDGTFNLLWLYEQETPGVFTYKKDFLTGLNPIDVAGTDIDGDGDQDLVVANEGTNNLSIFIQMTPGNFVLSPLSLDVGASPFAVSFADLDGNGLMDIVASNQASANLSIWYQTSSFPLQFTSGPTVPVVGALGGRFTVSFSDVNEDGVLDVVTATE